MTPPAMPVVQAEPRQGADEAPRDARASRPMDSEQILRGRRIVEISHNGELYRLQTTRLGKLILTK